METQLFNRFVPVIRSLTPEELNGSSSLYNKLSLASSNNLQICYAPFDHINNRARIVIVGITPGRQQMLAALQEARRQLDMGADETEALRAAKSVGAFAGEIRKNLIEMLDHVGIAQWLGIASCAALFGNSADLVQTTSALRNPVFLNGKDYNGSPSMTRNLILRQHLLDHFGCDVKALPDAVFVPLGGKVSEALAFLVDKGHLRENQILDGLPHPSPQNIERIRYFLGQKRKDQLSVKTNAAVIDSARESIMRKVKALK